MKPYRKQNYPRRPMSQPDNRAVPPASSPPPAVLHRYVHPIRTIAPTARTPSEDQLADVLTALSRLSDKVDEVLRRLERDNSDTL